MSARITSSPDELLVVNPERRSLRRSILGFTLVLFALWQSAKLADVFETSLHQMDTNVGLTHLLLSLAVLSLPVLVFFAFLWLMLQSIRPIFGSRQELRCTRSELELTSIDFGRIWRKRIFAKDDVQSASFGAVSISKYGAANGLVFSVHKTQIKALPGLKAKEAKQILNVMMGLGFDVSIDPAMKMVIEIEETRGRFWG